MKCTLGGHMIQSIFAFWNIVQKDISEEKVCPKNDKILSAEIPITISMKEVKIYKYEHKWNEHMNN